MASILLEKKAPRHDTSFTQNRELSWLRFNERVLEEAEDDTVPLYERLKFTAIFTSNLDEFFMVRVGSLMDLLHIKPNQRDNKSRMTPAEQLHHIFSACQQLYPKRDMVYENVSRKLAQAGIVHLDFADLGGEHQRYYEQEFREQILPVLSPQILDLHHPFPHLENKELFVAALLKHEHRITLGMIPVPHTLPQYLLLPSNRMEYLLIEEVMLAFIEQVFPSYPIIDRGVFCITRDADISPDDEEVEYGNDYLKQMKKVLHLRKHLPSVRIEIQSEGDSMLAPYLSRQLYLPMEQVYVTTSPLRLDFVYDLEKEFTARQKQQLCYPPFVSAAHADLFKKFGMMEAVRQKDRLLSYPYDDFNIFLRLIREAAYDPNTASIKITIYRIGRGHVQLMNYLIMASELGKEVTVLLELKARFDEANNMSWVDSLRDAGVHILYGFEGYKVHAKVCLITCQRGGELSYITYVGTGNFNAKTAHLYTDLALLTANSSIGRDAAVFFRNMGISNLYGEYRELLVAPVNLKKKLLALIQREIDKAVRGEEARILLKMNSLTDRELIDKLKEAGTAGVVVHMIVRGICCLVPGIHGKTENIHVRSIVGRFLEHARVFVFGCGKDAEVYIASADWMTRNTENRVEVGCPIYDPEIRRRILAMLDLQLRDNTKARRLGSDGYYHRLLMSEEAVNAQMTLARQAVLEKA